MYFADYYSALTLILNSEMKQKQEFYNINYTSTIQKKLCVVAESPGCGRACICPDSPSPRHTTEPPPGDKGVGGRWGNSGVLYPARSVPARFL